VQFVPLWTCINKNRKVHALSGDDFKFWIMCLTLAQEHDPKLGTLPDLDSISFALHMDTEEAEDRMGRLVAARLIDQSNDAYSIHDWQDWKYKPDPTNAERQRRFKAKHKPKTPVTPVTVTALNGKSNEVTPHLRLDEINSPTPLPPRKGGEVGDDELVAFGREAFGDRFDLEEIGTKLRGWRAAKYSPAWIKDALLVAGFTAQPGKMAAYANTCLRRWTARGSPDPEDLRKIRARAEPPLQFHKASPDWRGPAA
jgi:hypothetical protein